MSGMERSNEPTLLGLPAELRVRIFELVLYHRETGGVISPRPDFIDLDPGGNVAAATHMVLISGWRYQMHHSDTPDDLDESDAWAQPGMRHDVRPNSRTLEQRVKTWEESPNYATKHICNLDCLVQPSISLVNCQLRNESLPIFYGINHFHIELSNNEHSRFCKSCDLKRCPEDWWRAIGDRNLASLRHISLVGQGRWTYDIHAGAVVTYHKQQGAQMEWISGRDPEVLNESKQELRDEDGGRLREKLDTLAEEGPSVKTIESVVSWLEPNWARYLRGAEIQVPGLLRYQWKRYEKEMKMSFALRRTLAPF